MVSIATPLLPPPTASLRTPPTEQQQQSPTITFFPCGISERPPAYSNYPKRYQLPKQFMRRHRYIAQPPTPTPLPPLPPSLLPPPLPITAEARRHQYAQKHYSLTTITCGRLQVGPHAPVAENIQRSPLRTHHDPSTTEAQWFIWTARSQTTSQESGWSRFRSKINKIIHTQARRMLCPPPAPVLAHPPRLPLKQPELGACWGVHARAILTRCRRFSVYARSYTIGLDGEPCLTSHVRLW